MKHYLHRWVLLKELKKRQVCLPVCILQNVIEVSYRLMIMNCEDEIEFIAAFQKEFLLGKVSRIGRLNINYTTPESLNLERSGIPDTSVLFQQV